MLHSLTATYCGCDLALMADGRLWWGEEKKSEGRNVNLQKRKKRGGCYARCLRCP